MNSTCLRFTGGGEKKEERGKEREGREGEREGREEDREGMGEGCLETNDPCQRFRTWTTPCVQH